MLQVACEDKGCRVLLSTDYSTRESASLCKVGNIPTPNLRELFIYINGNYKTVKEDGADANFWGCVTFGGEGATRNMAGNIWSTKNKYIYSLIFIRSTL